MLISDELFGLTCLSFLLLKGQLYKVNVPVVVTQAPAVQQTLSQPPQTVTERIAPPVPPPASSQPTERLPREPSPEPVPIPADSLPPLDSFSLPSQESSLPQQDPMPEYPQFEVSASPDPESAQ